MVPGDPAIAQRVVVIRQFGQHQRDRWVRTARWAVSQPSWVARAAMLTMLLVIGVPLAILFGLAMLAGLAVFGGLALVHAAVTGVRGAFGGPRDAAGRENVRIIRRDE